MNKLLLTLLLGIITWHAPKVQITHYNITFAPDLSNRVNQKLYPRPLSDIDLLRILTENFYPAIVNQRRSQQQHDRLLVDFINKGLIASDRIQTEKLQLDIGRFGYKQEERINYLKNYPTCKKPLRQDIAGMMNEFSRVYRQAIKANVGADVWTYLDQGINDANVFGDETPVNMDGVTYINRFRNILILPTDGYIEAGIFGKGFDLSKTTVDRFRKAFISSGETDMATFFKKNKEYRIRPVHNDHLKQLEILVLELYDRSLTPAGSATVHPTDMEIMKIFWTDWLHQCGVKHFELHPYANSKDEAERIILNFMNVDKK